MNLAYSTLIPKLLNIIEDHMFFCFRQRGDRMEAEFLTDRGQIRTHNEDAGGTYYNLAGQLLAIIADGMGGHQAGDVASQMAVSMIQDKWQHMKEIITPEQSEKWLAETISEINTTIYNRSLDIPACEGMGTTVVIVISTEEYITVAHIGDSRCYIFNEDGFKQITEDHSLVNELIRTGQISKDDAVHHPRKNVVLRALGTEREVTADIKSLGWEKHDKLLLCSDGLTDKVLDDELFELIQLDEPVKEMGQKMINLANERGGEDNISLIIVDYESAVKEGDMTC